MESYKSQIIETLYGILFVFSIGSIYLLSGNGYLTVGTFVLTIMVWFKYSEIKETEHFKKLAKDRIEDSICTFVRSFEYRELDTRIIRAVYEEIQLCILNYERPFPIHADDDLFKDLHLDEDDIDMDICEAISIRTNRTLEDCENNPFFGKVWTPRDLVMFFQAQPHVKTI